MGIYMGDTNITFGLQGKDGKNGVSPTISVSEITGGHQFTINDVNGSKSVNIMDGKKGNDGLTYQPVMYEDGDKVMLRWTTGMAFNDPVNIKGDKGEAGATGAEGAAGTNGIDGADGADGYSPIRGVDYWTEADVEAMEEQNINFISAELAKRNQLKPEFVNSIEECTDTTKLYVLPDGYIYAYMYGEAESTYTNILETATVSLNSRYNSSNTLKDAVGYIAVDYMDVKNGDVVRFKPSTLPYGNASGYQRLRCYDSSGTLVSLPEIRIDSEYAITISDGVASLTIPTSATTQATYSNISKMRMNLFVAEKTLTEADLEGVVVTINEEIGGTTAGYAWTNTGRAFVPTDYEDRIVELENKEIELTDKVAVLNDKLKNTETNSITLNSIFAPSPQLPADGSSESDFNAETCTTQNIYDYIDALCVKYPNYITKEVMGKDESGTYDCNRYVLCKHYYSAWQRQNYPKMYAWVNGSTVIYSVSVSPRIGDTMYSTAYIGTVYKTVTAVDNANQSRTVNGLVFTRNKTKDVEPTLVYTSILDDKVGGIVCNVGKASVTTIKTLSTASFVGNNNITYTRYPMGDRDKDMIKSIVVTIGANEHAPNGDPREPAIVVARLVKDLCECKHSDNELLNHLKNNVMLIVVPVINPYGFTLGTTSPKGDGYFNANGVNINRNYDCPGWGNLTDAGPQGDYGGSENETQYFMNTLTEANSDVGISVHCLGYTNGANDGFCHYQGNGFNSEKIKVIAEKMKCDYNLNFTSYGTADPTTNAGGKSPAYITWAGAKGGIIEMQAREGYVGGEDALHTERVLEADYTLLLSCVYMWLMDGEG